MRGDLLGQGNGGQDEKGGSGKPHLVAFWLLLSVRIVNQSREKRDTLYILHIAQTSSSSSLVAVFIA